MHARDKFLRTPLHWAALYCHEIAVDVLVKSNSDIFCRDSLGRSPFIYAACANGGTGREAIRCLTIMVGVDPEIVMYDDSTHRRTALHYAIFSANPKRASVIRKLLEFGVPINAVDEDRKTALHYAAEHGKGKVIPLLVQNGARVDI